MAPKYKLTYFDTQGAGEHIRYIFAYANKEYEDYRISRDDWPTLKPTTPFGKLPILEVDGKTIAQSNAIARYLARQFGLTGKDDWESLQCDVLVDTLKDLHQGFYPLFSEKDPVKKEELRKELVEKDIPFYLGKFNKIAEDNPSGLLIGSQITWADLDIATFLDMLEQSKPGFLKPYPGLEKLHKKIHSIPGVKTWIEKRPSSTFKLPID